MVDEGQGQDGEACGNSRPVCLGEVVELDASAADQQQTQERSDDARHESGVDDVQRLGAGRVAQAAERQGEDDTTYLSTEVRRTTRSGCHRLGIYRRRGRRSEGRRRPRSRCACPEDPESFRPWTSARRPGAEFAHRVYVDLGDEEPRDHRESADAADGDARRDEAGLLRSTALVRKAGGCRET